MNINQKSKFNLILQKYKEKYSYACECRKDIPRNVMCIVSKNKILFVELSRIYNLVILFSVNWVRNL